MRQNSRIDRQDNFYRQLRRLAAVELLIICVWSLLSGATTSDSITYFEAWDTIISGSPDDLRTPLYPLIVGSLRAIFGNTVGLAAVYLLQSALFILSIGWMRELTEALVANRRIAKWTVAIYALYPGPLTMCGIILTESLALTGSVGLLLLSYRAFSRPSAASALWSGLVMAALIMLRPALIYLPVAFLLFWLIVACLRQSSPAARLAGVGSSLGAMGVLALYCMAMSAAYGVFGPSTVSGTNNYFTVRSAGIMNPEELPLPELRAIADSLLKANGEAPDLPAMWDEVAVLSSVASPVEMGQYTSRAIKAHPVEVAKFMLTQRLADVCAADCIYGGSVCPPLRALTKPFSVNNGAAFLMLLLLMITMARADLRSRRFSTFMWFLCGLLTVTYATVTIGAQNEWPRLLLPGYPVLLILAASLMSRATAAASDR